MKMTEKYKYTYDIYEYISGYKHYHVTANDHQTALNMIQDLGCLDEVVETDRSGILEITTNKDGSMTTRDFEDFKIL